MNLKQRAISLLTEVEIGEKVVLDQRYRIILSAATAFAFNLLYALYHFILGIMNRSLWFLVLCAFYGILATMRFSTILYKRNRCESPCDDMEVFVMRFSGILLIALSLVLATVSYISLSQNIAAKYEEVMMITIATYTFYKITIAIVKAVRQRKNSSPLIQAIQNISCAEVSASILTLQRSMLASFGTMDSKQVYLMNAITGAAVCLFVMALGLSMIRKSKGEYE